jgi:hypothetical protein
VDYKKAVVVSDTGSTPKLYVVKRTWALEGKTRDGIFVDFRKRQQEKARREKELRAGVSI